MYILVYSWWIAPTENIIKKWKQTQEHSMIGHNISPSSQDNNTESFSLACINSYEAVTIMSLIHSL